MKARFFRATDPNDPASFELVERAMAHVQCLCSSELAAFAQGYNSSVPFDPRTATMFLETTRQGFAVFSLARVEHDLEFRSGYQIANRAIEDRGIAKGGKTAFLSFFCSTCSVEKAAAFLRFIEATLAKRGVELLQVRALVGTGVDFFLSHGFGLWVPGGPVLLARPQDFAAEVARAQLLFGLFGGQGPADLQHGVVLSKAIARNKIFQRPLFARIPESCVRGSAEPPRRTRPLRCVEKPRPTAPPGAPEALEPCIVKPTF